MLVFVSCAKIELSNFWQKTVQIFETVYRKITMLTRFEESTTDEVTYKQFKKIVIDKWKKKKKNSFYKYLHYALFLCNWERIPGSFCNNSSFDSWKSLSTHKAVNASRIVPISLLSVNRKKRYYFEEKKKLMYIRQS